MKFCSIVPEICRGKFMCQRKKETRRRIRIRIIIIIIIRNGAKTISLPIKGVKVIFLGVQRVCGLL
jgi:hypothetical protein